MNVHAGSDRQLTWVRAQQAARREIRAVERLRDTPWRRQRVGVVVPSRLVAANAALVRLQQYRHLLPWEDVVARLADACGDELPDDIVRWVLDAA